VDNKKQLPTPLDFRCLGEYWDEEGVYKDGFEVGLQQCKDQGRRLVEGCVHDARRVI